MQSLITQISKEIKTKNLLSLKEVVERYNGTAWKKYVRFDPVTYQRVKAFSNPIFEILVLCWNKKQFAPIHDHPENGCLMKLVQGELVEEFYNPEFKLIRTTPMRKNSVSYMDNTLGLHKIINRDCQSVSIHVYSPPDYKPNYFS